MRFALDHDLHIHSNISSCANYPDNTPNDILQAAKRVGSGLLPSKPFLAQTYKLWAADWLLLPHNQAESIFTFMDLRCIHSNASFSLLR